VSPVTVIVENGPRKTYSLDGRVAAIVAWLAGKADEIERSSNGKLTVHYAGDHLKFEPTMIEEHRVKK
jgi:hypothetical protein